MSETNPYRPPTIPSAENVELSELQFDGEITEQDYIDLLPQHVTVAWLLRILLVLLIPLTVIMFAISGYVILSEGIVRESLLSVFAAFFIGVLSFVAIRTLLARYRGRRNLKHHRDLLGLARGTLNKNGLVVFDGRLSHWYSPKALEKVAISEKGIRIPIDANSYRYLALTARLFDHYDAKSIRSLRDAWSVKSASAVEGSDDWAKAAFSEDEGPPWAPAGDSRFASFAGSTTTQFPMKSRELRTKTTAETVASATLLFFAGFAFFGGNLITGVVLFLFSALAIWNSIQYWRQYFFGIETRTWYQVGWINKEVIAIRHETHGSLCPWGEVAGVNLTPELITIVGPNNWVTHVGRNQVASETEWRDLTRWGSAHATI